MGGDAAQAPLDVYVGFLTYANAYLWQPTAAHRQQRDTYQYLWMRAAFAKFEQTGGWRWPAAYAWCEGRVEWKRKREQ